MRALAILLLLVARSALAAQPVVEAFQGPVISSQRVLGLGGAAIGIAEGVEAQLVNPAAFAVRDPFSGDGWFDWDLGVQAFTVPGHDGDLDYGRKYQGLDTFGVGQLGANLKFGRFGFGVQFTNLQYWLPSPKGSKTVDRPCSFCQTFFGFGFAYAFLDGQLVVGELLSQGGATLNDEASGGKVQLDSEVGLYQSGLLWAPRDQPWRLGLVWQAPIDATRQVDGGGKHVMQTRSSLGGYDVPRAVHMPWTLGLGGSWQFGVRPANLRPSYGERPLPDGARLAQHVPRTYTLVALDVVAFGPSPRAVSAPSYLAREAETVGRSTVLGVRAGVESEFWPDRVRLRLGSYFEPSRHDDRWGRIHVTGGADLRVTALWNWRFSVAADAASGWLNTSLGLGFWH